MATEQVTRYPVNFRDFYPPMANDEQRIHQRLTNIEERLSRIEELIRRGISAPSE